MPNAARCALFVSSIRGCFASAKRATASVVKMCVIFEATSVGRKGLLCDDEVCLGLLRWMSKSEMLRLPPLPDSLH